MIENIFIDLTIFLQPSILRYAIAGFLSVPYQLVQLVFLLRLEMQVQQCFAQRG
jgi:hypothetical protein